MNQTTIRPIRSEEDLDLALERIDELMDAQQGSPEANELEVLAQLVESYEDKHCPIGLPSPLAAIKFRMEQGNLSERDLERFLDHPSE